MNTDSSIGTVNNNIEFNSQEDQPQNQKKICDKHNKDFVYVCCLSEWHCELLCPECIPSHTKSHKQNNTNPLIETVEESIKICSEKLSESLKNYTQQKETISQLVINLNTNQDQNQINLKLWKQQLHDLVDKQFIQLEGWYQNVLNKVNEEKRQSYSKINQQFEKEISDINNLIENLNSSDKFLKGIKFSFNKNYNEKINLQVKDYMSISEHKIQELLVLNQESFDQIQKSITQIVWQTSINNINNQNDEKSQDNKKKPYKPKQHFCQQCGTEMQYLSDFKKHLSCPNCQKVKRNYGTVNKNEQKK